MSSYLLRKKCIGTVTYVADRGIGYVFTKNVQDAQTWRTKREVQRYLKRKDSVWASQLEVVPVPEPRIKLTYL